MATFTWKYGSDLIPFTETLDERKYWDYISEDSEGSEGSEELPFKENIDEDDFVQPSEYLFDIHFTKLMEKTVSNNEYNIAGKSINLYYNALQKFLAYNKYLLVKIDKKTNLKYSENADAGLREEMLRFIESCRNTWWNGKVFDEIRGDFPDFFRENSKYYEDVIAIENYFHSEKHSEQPYYLYERMVLKISPLIGERRELAKMIMCVLPYYKFHIYNNNSKLLTCQIILSDERYSEFIDQANNLIVSETEKTINSYLSAASIDDDNFRQSADHMIKCIKSCDKRGNHNFGQFLEDKPKCFCIFDINSNKYISLSGPFDACSKIVKNLHFSKKKKQSNNDLKNKVKNIILTDPVLKNSKYARFNLSVKRYNPNAQTMYKAIKGNENADNLQNDFSCCERKIFSYIKNSVSGQCYMFVRHKPCGKCIPAIKEFLRIPGRKMKIFYYGTYSDGNEEIEEFDMSTI